MGVWLLAGVEVVRADPEAAVQDPSGAALAIARANGVRR